MNHLYLTISLLLSLLLQSVYAQIQYEDMLVHQVLHGENLSDIAKRYKVSVSELIEYNQLRDSHLYAGQTLIVKKLSSTPSPTPNTSPSTNVQAAQPAPNQRTSAVDTQTSSLRYLSATEQAEDVWARTNLRLLGEAPSSSSPSYVARMAANDRFIAQQRQIRTGGAAQSANTRDGANLNRRVSEDAANDLLRASAIYHRVSRDEDIYDIAERYGVRVKDIQMWNQVRNVYAGQRLIIYTETDPNGPILQPENTSLQNIENQLNGNPNENISTSTTNKRVADPSQTQTGTFETFEWEYAKTPFYIAHKSLPVGSEVKLMLPNNLGFIRMEVVAYQDPRSKVDFSLSRMAARLLEIANNDKKVPQATLMLGGEE